jgi:hypothetical protein
MKKTFLKNYGVENPFQSDKIKRQILKNNLKKYGVEYPQQNKEIHEKGQKTAKLLKIFKNTTIWYQGSYELDFLEKYYNKYPNIECGPSIKYTVKGNHKSITQIFIFHHLI